MQSEAFRRNPSGIDVDPAEYVGRYRSGVSLEELRQQFVKKIALIGDTLRSKVPEVMMRIADRNLRLQCWLLG
jgi:hypothetical protein